MIEKLEEKLFAHRARTSQNRNNAWRRGFGGVDNKEARRDQMISLRPSKLIIAPYA